MFKLEDEGYGEAGHQPDERHGQTDLAKSPELDAEPDLLLAWRSGLGVLKMTQEPLELRSNPFLISIFPP